MNSCAASSCMCFRKASCAFGTSDSSPTGGAPHFCRFAFICSVRCNDRRPNQKHPLPMNRALFGAVPVWWADEGHRKAYSYPDPASFSSRPGHGCRMKPKLCAFFRSESCVSSQSEGGLKQRPCKLLIMQRLLCIKSYAQDYLWIASLEAAFLLGFRGPSQKPCLSRSW